MADIKYLATFIQVVNRGSFSAAAKHLGVTPPAVSKSIARLESSLGVRLLNRNTRNLHLTSEGRDFFEKISALMSEIDKTVEDLKDATQVPEGQVRVAVGATFGRYFLLPVLAEFFARYPQIALELDFDDNPKDLLERGFDVGIRQGQGDHFSYVSRRLTSDYPIILVASPRYLAERGVPRTLEQLAGHDCIGAGSNVRIADSWKLQRVPKAGKSSRGKKNTEYFPVPRGRLTVNTQFDTTLNAALHDLGIAFVALPAAVPFLKAGHLKIVMPDYVVKNTSSTGDQIFIQYPHREYLPPKVRVLVEYLLEIFHREDDHDAVLHTYSA